MLCHFLLRICFSFIGFQILKPSKVEVMIPYNMKRNGQITVTWCKIVDPRQLWHIPGPPPIAKTRQRGRCACSALTIMTVEQIYILSLATPSHQQGRMARKYYRCRLSTDRSFQTKERIHCIVVARHDRPCASLVFLSPHSR